MVDFSRLFELRLNGYCCSQILLKMGMEDAQLEDNPELIQAMRGLCDGMQTDMVCGILTSTACLIALLQPEDAKIIITDVVEWFKSEYEESNGDITCQAILDGNPMNRTTKCPHILAATYDKAMELMEINGLKL
ncbi:C-GCAxxG-C-C family protein [Dehalobacter sp. DCM]|uniref:DVU_1555 family C-GCAxxG-C-C protein n=1 Tax=Dehalobacter sp. DCM TaxID=2907827 RepID=UPI0030812B31|nr:C-GCAxxG-C-C family protein [Dehalobacter sp. DCM]